MFLLIQFKKFLFLSLNLLIKLFKRLETSLTIAKSTFIFFPIEREGSAYRVFFDLGKIHHFTCNSIIKSRTNINH